MSIYVLPRRGLKLTNYRSYGNLISDKIKRDFFQAVAVLELLSGYKGNTLSKIFMGITLKRNVLV